VSSIRIASSFAALPFLIWAGGCSSQNNTTGGGVTSPDGGSGSHVGPGDGGGAGDGGACMPPASVPAADAPSYVAVQQVPNACTPAQIQAFLSACLGGSRSSCNSWLQDSSNDKCLGCLAPQQPQNGGGLLFGPSGTDVIGTNLPGCIALADASNGSTCAQALEPALQCDAFACGGSCADQASYEGCAQAANASGGACNDYANHVKQSCASDFVDAGAAVTKCASDPDILNVICGTGG
jgi:hypothetical protein